MTKEGKIPVALLASADAGKNEAKMADVMAKAMKQAEADGAKVATETFKDVKITVVRENGDDNEPMVWAQKGSVFLISSDVDVLKDYLSNGPTRAEGLATSETYINTMKGVGKDSHVSFYLDFSQVLKLAAQANKDNAAQIEAQLQVTGVNGLKAIGAGFTFGAGDYDQLLKVFIYSPGPAQGILKIFSMPPIDLKPQAWVPASAVSYSSVSWDLDAAWKAITELADMFGAGGFLDQAQKGIGGPGGDFDFKKDLFGPLGNRITAVSDFKKPITEKSQRYLFGIALDDPKAFQNTFNKLLDVTKASPKKREFQGTTVYDFDVPNLPNGAGLDIQGPISVAIAKGTLFVSSEPAFLEQALRTGGASLAETGDYQAVAKKLPEKNSVLSFDKAEEQAKVLYEMFKSGKLEEAIKNSNPNAAEIKSPIDKAKVPDFSVFAKYLSQGGSYGTMDEQGFTITQFILRKANP